MQKTPDKAADEDEIPVQHMCVITWEIIIIGRDRRQEYHFQS